MTFFIALFVLLMQFLWKYVDDFIGKGLEGHIIAELMLYACASLVPLALPLAILLSSIMTFGNMGENYELVAMKSAGLSLQKIMAPLIVQTVLVCFLAFYFANSVLPVANLKFGTLIYDITHQKPAIEIKEGIFYNGIDNYSIRVAKKENNNNLLKNLMIYDHTQRMGSNKIIIAESGTMNLSPDKNFMLLHLFNGYSYDEQGAFNREKDNLPLVRVKFEEQLVRMDLTGFQLTRTDEDLFKDNYQMMNLSQLESSMDQLNEDSKKKQEDYNAHLSESFYRFRPSMLDSSFNASKAIALAPVSFKDFTRAEKLQALESASNLARSSKAYTESFISDKVNRLKYINRHQVEWHRKITLSFACIILFFIGAPLGAIIRKGGLGMPVVVSFFFFIIFHVITITGEKFVKENVMEPHIGMWLASFILLPVGVFLTYKASRDSVLFDMSSYTKIFKFFKKKKVTEIKDAHTTALS
ncbi:MAG: LptF/LptG family permease [Bacteroidetes bacterium]|nr:LptF/LptG family permease [Bacteroidota bacterium]